MNHDEDPEAGPDTIATIIICLLAILICWAAAVAFGF